MDAERLLLVANASAGTASDEAVSAALAVLGAHRDVRTVRTGAVDELAALVRNRQAGERIVVVGGDGSLHAVVQALRDAGGLHPGDPLGVIPLGTGNDLARCLGVPLDPAEAATLVLTGRARPLDLLVDEDGGVVVNAVHAGVGAEAAEAAGAWKERLGSAGYVIGSALAGISATGWHLRVEVDGAVIADGSDSALMVGLGLGTSIGGGALLTPDAVPDDGLVDVVVSLATGPMARVGYGMDLREGDHLEREDVRTARGKAVSVSGDEFGTNADGELAGPFTSRRWELHPRAWSLLTPA